MKKASEPMAVLPPIPVEIRVADQTIALTPLVLGELPAFARAIQPFTTELAVEPDWLRLLGSHGEAMIEAMTIASRQPRGWIAGLALDEAICLAQALFEVNADFFIRRVVPKVGEAVSRIGSQWAGPMPASA
ncbi:MAG: hypothetical protein ACK52G_04345 [Betaproteobacteria bacterium]